MIETDLNTAANSSIIEPDAIPYSFDTLGWHIVAGWLALLLLISAIVWLYYYQKNSYRRKAIKELQKLYTPSHQNIYQANYLLKLMALKVYGRKTTGNLNGKQWYSFLTETAKSFPLSSEQFSAFNSALYNPDYQLPEASYTQFIQFAIHWCKTHKVRHV